ncbi:MAG: hypothetical protein FWD61_02780 [Phycisphaerales bacterium]|nr:hypothetical protein [Phycisphaerales bacterium]
MATMSCYHHKSQDAVAQCNKCGKGICGNCFDLYGVSSGEYAGQALCYDCTTQLVAMNVAEIGSFRKRVRGERTWMIVGMVIFGFFGLMIGAANSKDGGAGGVLLGILFGAAIGGSLGTIIKSIYQDYQKDGEMNWIGAFITLLFSPLITLFRFLKRMGQISQANRIIENDSRVLREMRDYFAYTQTMENNKGVDLTTLASQGSALFDNSYAQSVLKKGEKAAQAELRKGVVQIAANGEIVRSFDPVKNPRNKAA